MTFKIATAFVAVEAHDDGLRTAITARIKAATEGLTADVGLGLNGTAITRLDAAVHQAAGEASAGNAVEVGIGLQESVETLREEVKAEVEGAGAGEEIKIPVKVDGDAFEHEFRTAMAEVEQASQEADRALTRSFSDVEKASRTVRASLDDVAPAAEDVGRKITAAGDKAANAGNKANNSSGGFLGLSAAMRAGIGAAVAFGPALDTIPVLAGAAAGGLGVLVLGLAGAIKALHDFGLASDATGQSSAQVASTALSNAIAVRNAEQAITDAKTQAARAQVTSAEAVRNAQQSLADTERAAGLAAQNSAAQVVSAQQRVDQAAYSSQQAELSYTNSLYAEQQAQQALTQAREDAANQLADASNAAADAHLAVEQAAINAANAQKNLNIVNATGTDDQKALADLQARQAVQALADAKQREVEAVQKATAAQKAGVDQAPSVLSAQHSLAGAAQAVADAQHGVATAAQGLADAQSALAKAIQAQAEQQISSAEQVGHAQQALADAQRSADQQRIDSAQQVQRAQQALSDTLAQQKLSAEAAASAGSAALNKFNQDMAKLTPQGQAFVKEVLSLRDSLHLLSADAQITMLPGFTQMLEGAKSLLPVVDGGVRGFGKALGDTAAAFGHLFQNPAFQAAAQQFTTLMVNGFGQFASALPPLLSAIVTDGAKAGPLIDAIGLGIHNILATGLPAFLDGLAAGSGGAAKGVGALFGAVDDLLGPIGKLVGAFSNALGPALANLEPEIKILADKIVNSLMPVMPQLSDALLAVVDVVDQLVPILTPLIPMIADGLSGALGILTPLLKETAGFLHDNADWLTPVAEGVLGLVAAVKAWHLATGLADDATKLWKKSMELFGSEGKIATTATKGWKVATSDLAGTLGTVAPIVGGIVGGAVMLGQWLGSVGDHARDAAAEVNKFTGSIIDLSKGAPNAGAEMDFLARSAVGFNKSVGGGAALLTDVDTSLANLVASGHADQAATAMDGMTKSVQQGGGSIDDLRKLLPHYSDALGAAANNTKQAGLEAKTAQQPFQGLTLRLLDTGQAGKNTADDLKRTDTALTNLDKQLGKQQALDDFTKALNGMKDGAAGSSDSIKGNSQSAMDNRKQLEDAIVAARHYYDAQIAAGVGVDQANASFQTQVDKLRTQAEKTYGSKHAVDDFLTSVGLIKPDYSTTLKVTDTEALKVVAGFQQVLKGLTMPNITLLVDKIVGANGISIVGTNVKARAEGGPVEPGQVYKVGERGEELVQFAREGTVIPHDQIRQVGGTTAVATGVTSKPAITNYFNYYGTQQPSVEQQADMMRRLALAVAA